MQFFKNNKGTYAIVSLMVIATLNRYNGILYPPFDQLPPDEDTNKTTKIPSAGSRSAGGEAISNCLHAGTAPNKALYLSMDPIEGRILLAMSLCLVTGTLQVIFAVLHVGVFTKYLSDSIVSGFTIGKITKFFLNYNLKNMFIGSKGRPIMS